MTSKRILQMGKHIFSLSFVIIVFLSCGKKEATEILVPSIFINAIDYEKESSFYEFKKITDLSIKGEVNSLKPLVNPKEYVEKIDSLIKIRQNYYDDYQNLLAKVSPKPKVPPIGPKPGPSPCDGCEKLLKYIVIKSTPISFIFDKTKKIDISLDKELSQKILPIMSELDKQTSRVSFDFSKTQFDNTTLTITDGRRTQKLNLSFR